ncbi:type VII secretion protein EccCb [Nocardioides sp. GY 10127]|uniref:type VII secretion protein EccCb n=1 Tax=Nocardioides sp. GY 10127 TaxID=2569762 RepID=UPI0010A7DB45|nr:type VII secretion protein EccCb [Nocardioides sp. GY 10127]TIC82532.1 type VII secretion protein EccCb [Nocardioides sp. GY 10127]
MSTTTPPTRSAVDEGAAGPAGPTLRPVPPLPGVESGGVLGALVPMVGTLGSVAVMLTLAPSSTGRALLAGGSLLAASLAYVAVGLERQRRHRATALGRSRGAYLRHLGQVRELLRARVVEVRHPDPAVLGLLAHQGLPRPGVGPGHQPAVRWGVRSAPDPGAPQAPPVGDDEPDPALADAARRLVDVWAERPEAAVLDLAEVGSAVLVPTPDDPDPWAPVRALAVAAAWAVPSERLALAVLDDTDAAGRGDDARGARAHEGWAPDGWAWLPHHRTAVGSLLRAGTTAQLARLLEGDTRHLLVLVGGAGRVTTPARLAEVRRELAGGREVTAVGRGAADEASGLGGARWEVTTTGPTTGPTTGTTNGTAAGTEAMSGVRPDRLSAAALATTARAIGLRLEEEAAHGPHAVAPLLARVAGKRPTPPAGPLTVTLGTGTGTGTGTEPTAQGGSAPVVLDLKESALGGSGPHGLVVGATGSGKSELLRTLVAGLVATHSPDDLRLALVDFKGGATFAGLEPAPHVAALLTNLEDDPALVDRMADALAGELTRRQALLRREGLASREAWEDARRRGRPLDPMPSLLVVVDEFAELLTARPDFVDTFVAVGRLGRSLGLHLLLASQRLEEGRLRGLEAHLSYRIGLRTFSEAESRAALGVPDAGLLPRRPGEALLRPGPGVLVRFRAGHVSGPVPLDRPLSRAAGRVRTLAEDAAAGWTSPPVGPDDSLLDAVVRTVATDPGPREASPFWLPPLTDPPPLDLDVPADGDLRLRVGLVDLPREQRQEPLVVDLGRGHLAVVGGPRSGRSTALACVALAAAARTAPSALRLYVLDLAGGALAGLDRLPHLAARVVEEPELVRRVLEEVEDLVVARERGTTGRPAPGRGRGDDGRVLLLVDGVAALADLPLAGLPLAGLPSSPAPAGDTATARLVRLAARGAAVGVHLAVTAGRWSELRGGLRDLCTERVELRLPDPVESEVDRRAAAGVPRHRPGHGLTADGHRCVLAAPEPGSTAGLGGAATAAERVAHRWPGPRVPALRVLPDRVDLAGLLAGPPSTGEGRRDVLALDERTLSPVGLDPRTDPHLLVVGEPGSGKTSALRALARSATHGRTPDGLRVLALDPRRSLLGDLPERHLLAHVSAPDDARRAVEELAAYLAARRPGPEVTPARLRARDWWTGAEVLVLVDDHDLLEAAGSPLLPLVPLLGHARDVGLRVAVARRSGGAARALCGPALQALRDVAAAGLLLPGDPDEGPLLGGLRPQRGVPGRARLVTRDEGRRTVQVAWSPPDTGPGET